MLNKVMLSLDLKLLHLYIESNEPDIAKTYCDHIVNNIKIHNSNVKHSLLMIQRDINKINNLFRQKDIMVSKVNTLSDIRKLRNELVESFTFMDKIIYNVVINKMDLIDDKIN